MKYLRHTIIPLLLLLSGCATPPEEITPNFYFPLPDEPGELITSEAQDFYLQTVAEELSFPWGMAFLPDGTVLITERGGTIRMVRNGILLEERLEGAPEVFVGGSSGLLDIAIHPDYERNGWIYISYSALSDGEDEIANTALMRARLSGHGLADQQVLLVGNPQLVSRQHSGSRIAIGNGYVYFSIGDRGFDHMDAAQDLSNHNGKIIRLHDDGRVPADNPFVGHENARPEIWSYGHRNPQGLAFQPATGMLWSHEHGPVGGDELNMIEKGVNYGWPEISFGAPDRGTTLSGETSRPGMRSAVHHWTPSIGPSGMAFVTSAYYPGWEGNMMVGAMAGNRLIRIVLDGNRVAHEEPMLEGGGRIRNVVEAPDGFLYIANESTGQISRLIPAGTISHDNVRSR